MRLSALAALVVLFASSSAQAGFIHQISYTTDFGNGSDGIPTPSGSVPQFDPNVLGGRLYSVQFKFEMFTIGGFLDVSNPTDQWVTVYVEFRDFATLGVVPNFTGPINIFANYIPATPFNNDLAPFDRYTTIGTDSYLKSTYQTKDASEKGAYTGSGELQFVTTHDFEIRSVFPDTEFVLGLSPDYSSHGTVTVTYTYVTPGPPGLVLGLSALPGIFFVRRFSLSRR